MYSCFSSAQLILFTLRGCHFTYMSVLSKSRAENILGAIRPNVTDLRVFLYQIVIRYNKITDYECMKGNKKLYARTLESQSDLPLIPLWVKLRS